MDKTFLIIGGRCYETRRLLRELKEQGKKATIINPEDLLMYVEDRKHGDCLYYLKGSKPVRIYKKDVAAVIPRIGKGLEVHAKAIHHIENLGIPVTSPSEGLLIARDKMLTTLKLSKQGIVTPKTILYRKALHFDWIVEKLGGFPIIAKLLSGSRGVGVFFLSDKLSASTSLETISTLGHSLQLQSYVESSDKDTNKHDYRVIIIDGKVECCIKRFSLSGDFRSNASISKQAENHEPDEDMKNMALAAAKAIGLEKCCGVDIVKRKEDGKMFVIECNGNFGFLNAEKFSKKNVAKKVVDFAIKLAENSPKDTEYSHLFAENKGLSIESDTDEGLPYGTFIDDLKGEDEYKAKGKNTIVTKEPESKKSNMPVWEAYKEEMDKQIKKYF
jgi:ribosomal protein S6--L-glutamate ligase